MESFILGCFIGIPIAIGIETFSQKRYGFPALSVFGVKCFKSKHFKWLIGKNENDICYYRHIIENSKKVI